MGSKWSNRHALRRRSVGRVCACAIGIVLCLGPSPAQEPPNAKVLDLILPAIRLSYAYENENSKNVSIESIRSEVAKLLARRDSLADEAVAALLQLEVEESVQNQLKSYVLSRGRPVIPALRKYRNTPFPLPNTAFPICFRLHPRDRVVLVDRLIEKIQGSVETGLPPRVNEVIIPLLKSLEASYVKGPGRPKAEDEFYRLFEILLKNESASADESLVILLDYRHDAGYSQMLKDEIVYRGKRTLKHLNKYQIAPTVSLASHFGPTLRNDGDTRASEYESLIEMIRMGELYGRN